MLTFLAKDIFRVPCLSRLRYPLCLRKVIVGRWAGFAAPPMASMFRLADIRSAPAERGTSLMCATEGRKMGHHSCGQRHEAGGSSRFFRSSVNRVTSRSKDLLTPAGKATLFATTTGENYLSAK